MKAIQKILSFFFPSKGSLLPCAIVGMSSGLFAFMSLMQRHFLSKRYLAYSLLIGLAVTLLAGWLWKRCLSGIFNSLSKNMRKLAVVFSAVLTMILLANTRLQPLYYLLPDTTLEIRIPIGEIPEGDESVRMLWIDTGQGYVHYTYMDIRGQWERVQKNIVFAPNQEIRISWRGKVGTLAETAFRMTPYDQPVFISWNGVEREYNLNKPEEPNVIIRDKFQIPILNLISFILSFFITNGSIIFALLLALSAWQPRQRFSGKPKQAAWMRYLLPMVILWTFTWLVFWPGIMTNDSMALWDQNLKGQYSDWQSAIYAILLAGLMKVWYSPAVVVLVQMLAFALLVAWGLGMLEQAGTPRLVLWGISLLFALSPLNNLYVITLWRDIPYALAFLWFTLLVLKVFLSQGKAVRGWTWLWLGVAGFLIAVLRQNGMPVVAAVLIILPVIYRTYWKELCGSLLAAGLLFAFAKGPLYSWAGVDREIRGQSNLILLHHIAAHLDAKTPLEEEERAYLESFLPISEWNYYCCYVGTISYDSNFARNEFLASSSANRQLALDLFLRDPLVDVRHAMCAGELAWRFENNQCYMKSTHGFNSWKPERISWIIPNEVGLHEDSKLPGLTRLYVDALRMFGFRDDYLAVYLRPAFYLYLSAFTVMAAVVRFRDLRAWLVYLPLLLQSGVLLLVSYAPAVRYQYSAHLVGLFLLSLLFLPKTTE